MVTRFAWGIVALVLLAAAGVGQSAAAQDSPTFVVMAERLGAAGQRVQRHAPVLERAEARARRQRRSGPVVLSRREADAIFDVTFVAALSLSTLDVQAGDANGAVRRWDDDFGAATRWGWFRAPSPRTRHDCRDDAVAPLLAPHSLDMVRSAVFAGDGEPTIALLRELATRRLLADEARRREDAGLSCEDLPNWVEWNPEAPELAAAHPALVRWVAIHVALEGRSGLEAFRDAKRSEPDAMFDIIVARMAERREADGLGGVAEPTIARCGEPIRPQAQPEGWAPFGFEPGSTWYAYSAAVLDDGAVRLEAVADIACNGEIERHVTIARMLDGRVTRSPTRIIVERVPSSRRDRLRAVFERLRPAVLECGTLRPGPATVRVTFDAEGQVTSADVAEPSASTPEGACVLDVLRRVAFPAFGQARFSASYRYAVDEALATPTVVELRGRE